MLQLVAQGIALFANLIQPFAIASKLLIDVALRRASGRKQRDRDHDRRWRGSAAKPGTGHYPGCTERRWRPTLSALAIKPRATPTSTPMEVWAGVKNVVAIS